MRRVPKRVPGFGLKFPNSESACTQSHTSLVCDCVFVCISAIRMHGCMRSGSPLSSRWHVRASHADQCTGGPRPPGRMRGRRFNVRSLAQGCDFEQGRLPRRRKMLVHHNARCSGQTGSKRRAGVYEEGTSWLRRTHLSDCSKLLAPDLKRHGDSLEI